MRKNIFTILKIIKTIFSSLTPLAVIISILIIVGFSLVIYDQVLTYKDRELGSSLINSLKVDGSCSNTVNAGEKFDIDFNLTNDNDVPIKLEAVGVDKSLSEVEEKKFLDLTAIKPPFSESSNEKGREVYNFENVVTNADSKLPISLIFQAKGRSEAGANPHTIVIYQGKISFDFEHEITIEVPCQIQVRYAD